MQKWQSNPKQDLGVKLMCDNFSNTSAQADNLLADSSSPSYSSYDIHILI